MKRIFSVIFISLLFLFVGCSPKEENPKETTREPVSSYNSESYQRSSTVSSYSDNNGYNSSSTYWYVYFTVDSDWEGFLIEKIDKPYFSLEEAANQIRDNWSSARTADFIGITFFSQVTEECYNEYVNARE